MKIYSEKTNKEYATVDECLEAEKAFDEQVVAEKAKKDAEQKALVAKKEAAIAERKAAAEVVENKRQALISAQKEYREELSKFCDKFGAYHYTIKGNGDSIFSLFDDLFNSFWL
jgi:BioD-like phosphotransacetylase family protein